MLSTASIEMRSFEGRSLGSGNQEDTFWHYGSLPRPLVLEKIDVIQPEIFTSMRVVLMVASDGFEEFGLKALRISET